MLSLSVYACSSGKESAKPDSSGGDATAEGTKGGENIKGKPEGNEKVNEYDLNGDKKPDVWPYSVPAKTPEGKEYDRLSRKELDLNWDGKVDVARTYDEK